MTTTSLDTELQLPLSDHAQKQTTQARSWPRHSPLSPAQMVAVMALAIFICECGVMFLLYKLPPLEPIMEAIVDSSALLLSLLPFYFFLYHPFWREHQQFSTEVSVLSRKLIKSVEDERKRLSHDLHDQFGQTLTALKFRTDALQKCIPQENTDQQNQVREMSHIITQLSNELREVTCLLRPETLDKLGLVPAMQNLAAGFRAILPEVKIDEHYELSDRTSTGLNETVELTLYRVCQECLHNIGKFAEAELVTISLKEQAEQILLVDTDDGVGFVVRRFHDGQREGRQGIGLLGIRERVDDLGGTFDLTTQPGSGTTVKVIIPIASEGVNGTSN